MDIRNHKCEYHDTGIRTNRCQDGCRSGCPLRICIYCRSECGFYQKDYGAYTDEFYERHLPTPSPELKLEYDRQKNALRTNKGSYNYYSTNS